MARLLQHVRQELGWLKVGAEYLRVHIPEYFGQVYDGQKHNNGCWRVTGGFALFVTLEGGVYVNAATGKQLSQGFAECDAKNGIDQCFVWVSQNSCGLNKHGQRTPKSTEILSGVDLHLFVRDTRKVGSRTAPFTYHGIYTAEHYSDLGPKQAMICTLYGANHD